MTKRQLIARIVARVTAESPFSEKSGYTLETMIRVLKEELAPTTRSIRGAASRSDRRGGSR